MSLKRYYRSLADCHEWKSVVGPCSWVIAAIILVLSSVRPMSAPHKSRLDQTVKKGAPSLARAQGSAMSTKLKRKQRWVSSLHVNSRKIGEKTPWRSHYETIALVCKKYVALLWRLSVEFKACFIERREIFSGSLVKCDECAKLSAMIWWFSRLKF